MSIFIDHDYKAKAVVVANLNSEATKLTDEQIRDVLIREICSDEVSLENGSCLRSMRLPMVLLHLELGTNKRDSELAHDTIWDRVAFCSLVDSVQWMSGVEFYSPTEVVGV